MPPPPTEPILTSLKKLAALFTARDKWLFCALCFALAVGALLDLVGIGIIPAFVAAMVSPERLLGHRFVLKLIPAGVKITPRQLLMFGSLIIVLFFLLRALYGVLIVYFQIRITHTRQLMLGYRLFKAYLTSPYEFLLQRNSAGILRNINAETNAVIDSVVVPLLAMFQHGLLTLLIVGTLVSTDPLISVASLLFFGISSLFILRKSSRKVKASATEAQLQRFNLVKAVQQGLGALKEVKILGKERFFADQFMQFGLRRLKAIQYRVMLARSIPRIMEFLAVVGLLAVIMLMIAANRDIKNIAPLMSLFALAFLRLKNGISQLTSSATMIRYGLVSITPVYDDLHELTAMTPKRFPREQREKYLLTRSIVVSDVSFSYQGSDAAVLKNIDIEIRSGEAVAFVGPTGSGKTTIVDLIIGVLKPTHGAVLVDGRDIQHDIRGWQNQIGYIPQSIYLTDDTIRRNIALGCEDRDIDEAALQQAVAAAQLERFVEEQPQGLDTVIGERGVRISGGQRQRIGIARALYINPAVLIMDEATSALDNATEKAVIDAVNQQRGKRTIITIAHRLSTVKDADRLFFLVDGRLEANGTYSELAEQNALFREMARQG